jgi:hypothetical protein
LNDPGRRLVSLTMRGKVDVFANFSDRAIVLKGAAGEKIVSYLQIHERRAYPFKVLKVTARNGRDIKFQVKQLEGADPAIYKLTVENKKSTPGRYFDTIFLQTDSSVHPMININVTGIIQAQPQS